MPNSALSSIRVVDFAGVLAGTYCTMLLADFGADVIKIESLEGDELRQWGPPGLEGESAYCLSLDRNKRGITLDLRNPKRPSIVRRLSERADAFVESFKAAGKATFGLYYEQGKLAIDFFILSKTMYLDYWNRSK